MSPNPSFSRFFNPLMLWVDVALKMQEMLLSSSSVIQLRTERMAKAGLQPNDADLAEFQLMSHEKLEAASASGAAMVNQLHTTQFMLVQRAAQEWLQGATALLSLSTSIAPAQIATHAKGFADATTRSVALASQFGSAGARIVQRGLKPIHATATSNARRLAAVHA